MKLLGECGLGWNSLPEFFRQNEGSVDKDGPVAHKKLIEWLVKQQFVWSSDLPAILSADWVYKNPTSVNAAAAQTADGPHVYVLELELALLEDYVSTTTENRMIIALWTLASHVFDQFLVEVLEVLGREVRQNRLVYLFLAEYSLILPEAEAPQADYDVHDGAHNRGSRTSWSRSKQVSR